ERRLPGWCLPSTPGCSETDHDHKRPVWGSDLCVPRGCPRLPEAARRACRLTAILQKRASSRFLHEPRQAVGEIGSWEVARGGGILPQTRPQNHNGATEGCKGQLKARGVRRNTTETQRHREGTEKTRERTADRPGFRFSLCYLCVSVSRWFSSSG